MNAGRARALLGSRRGVTFAEILVAAAIFTFVVIAISSLYVFVRGALTYGSAEAFVQRQGTMIQERLAQELQWASRLQVLRCGETLSAVGDNESLIYEAGDGTGFWCVFRQLRASHPYPLLWRCPVADASPSQTCSATPESLVPLVPVGQLIEVRVAKFEKPSYNEIVDAARFPCSTCQPLASLVDIRFQLDLRDGRTADIPANKPSLLWKQSRDREFRFNAVARN